MMGTSKGIGIIAVAGINVAGDIEIVTDAGTVFVTIEKGETWTGFSIMLRGLVVNGVAMKGTVAGTLYGGTDRDRDWLKVDAYSQKDKGFKTTYPNASASQHFKLSAFAREVRRILELDINTTLVAEAWEKTQKVHVLSNVRAAVQSARSTVKVAQNRLDRHEEEMNRLRSEVALAMARCEKAEILEGEIEARIKQGESLRSLDLTGF